jgi:hypothetical protein
VCSHECGHDGGDCSFDESFARCYPLHNNRALTNRPGNTSFAPFVLGTNRTDVFVPVEPRVTRLEPFHVELDETKWRMAVGFTLQLRWRDSRFPLLPCTLLLPQLLAMRTSTDARGRSDLMNYSSMLWMPRAAIAGAALSYTTAKDPSTLSATPVYAITRADLHFTPEDVTPWESGVLPPDGGESCYDCLTHTVALQSIFVIDAPVFTFFPFDEHTFEAPITVGGADLFSCAHIVSALNLTTAASIRSYIGKEWVATSISAGHAQADGEPDRSTCVLKVRTMRSTVLFYRRLCPPTDIATTLTNVGLTVALWWSCCLLSCACTATCSSSSSSRSSPPPSSCTPPCSPSTLARRT